MPFTPTAPPAGLTVDQLGQWFVAELERLGKENLETIALELRQVGRAPDKPREGMIVSANGSTFNPGAGAGAYEYKGGAWVKL